MPQKLERELWAEVRRRQREGRPIKDPDAYVYGTLRKSGWTPSTQRGRSRSKLDDCAPTTEPHVGLISAGGWKATVRDENCEPLATAKGRTQQDAIANARAKAGQNRTRGRYRYEPTVLDPPRLPARAPGRLTLDTDDFARRQRVEEDWYSDYRLGMLRGMDRTEAERWANAQAARRRSAAVAGRNRLKVLRTADRAARRRGLR